MATNQTEALLAALHTLYSDSDRASKEHATSFLETFQKSVRPHLEFKPDMQ
jgi:hypothetical protein